MRPLHLVGLKGVGGEQLRLHAPARAPLLLSALIPLIDQEQILAFYQEILASEGRLPRIEVDWVRSLLPADRRFLRMMRGRHGGKQCLVVVKIRRPLGDRPTVDLLEVLSQPELEPFEYIAVSAVDPLENESLLRLAQLAKLVTEVARDRYQEIADELGLNREAFGLIQERVKALLNPVDILEAVNALIDVQVESHALAQIPATIRANRGLLVEDSRHLARAVEDPVVWRLLSGMIEARPIEEQVLLIAVALGKRADAETLLGYQYDDAWDRLRAAQLIRKDCLAGWASWLVELNHVQLTREVTDRIRTRHLEAVLWLEAIREWFPETANPSADDTLRQRILSLFGLIDAGRLARAEEEVRVLQPWVERPDVARELRADLWDAMGRLGLATGHPILGPGSE